MNRPEPSFSVNVDVTNPGQFFACCGLLELADRLWPGAEGWFETDRFFVSAPQGGSSLMALLKHLADVKAQPLPGSKDPKLPPIHLAKPLDIRIDWWLDFSGGKTILGKMFSGQKRTFKDVKRLQQALAGAVKDRQDAVKLFEWSTPMTGRFGVDPRAAWEALDLGFSPNDQQVSVSTFFVVELMGAIGLQSFPPRRDADAYLYGKWLQPLPASVARAAAAGLIHQAKHDRFRFQLTQRGSYKGFDTARPVGD